MRASLSATQQVRVAADDVREMRHAAAGRGLTSGVPFVYIAVRKKPKERFYPSDVEESK